LASAFGGARDDVITTIWFVFFLLFAVCLMVNTLRGPTCSVQVRTAVQNQNLSGVSRWRKADALMAALAPLLNAAQSSSATAAQSPVTPAAAVVADDPNAPPQAVS
jgi:hypothetical protein